jgi:hypothetical protein
MAEESKGKLTRLETSAADVLLDAVSKVREDTQLVLILKHGDGEFLIEANINLKDIHWNLSQAIQVVLSGSLSDIEGDADAS